jgi:quercetin dioxygenase-like cupin family protein
VISGSVYTLGRRLGPGDFVHADAGTEHGELWTDEGARVLLVVQPEDYMRSPAS